MHLGSVTNTAGTRNNIQCISDSVREKPSCSISETWNPSWSDMSLALIGSFWDGWRGTNVCNHFNLEDPAGVVVLPKVATAAPLLTGCMVGGCQLKFTENNNNRKLCRWLNGLTWGHRLWRAPLQGRPGRGSRTGGALFGCWVKKQ